MIINLKNGVGQLLFGMKQKDVESLLGNPDKKFQDEDQNMIYIYNREKLRLTFYEDEAFRLGYIITSNHDSLVLEHKVIGSNIEETIAKLPFKNWETEAFDSTINYFNESNWLTFQTEFDEIIRIELGAIINDKDEIDWKFK